MSQSLVFQNTSFSVVDRNGQPWIRANQIGLSLGYKNPELSIAKLFRSNKDEFTDSMTALVKLETAGGIQEVRIFSMRGAHLLAVFARTAIAKAFRVWVLDLLDRETKTITPAMQSDLHAIVDKISPDGKKKGNVWSRFNRHFKIAKYNQLQSAQFEEAKTYLVNTFLEGEYIEREALSEAEISQLAIKALVETKFALRFVQMENGQLLPQVFSHHKDAQTFVPAGLIRDIRDKTFKFMPDDMIPDLISAISHRLRTPATA